MKRVLLMYGWLVIFGAAIWLHGSFRTPSRNMETVVLEPSVGTSIEASEFANLKSKAFVCLAFPICNCDYELIRSTLSLVPQNIPAIVYVPGLEAENARKIESFGSNVRVESDIKLSVNKTLGLVFLPRIYGIRNSKIVYRQTRINEALDLAVKNALDSISKIRR